MSVNSKRFPGIDAVSLSGALAQVRARPPALPHRAENVASVCGGFSASSSYPHGDILRGRTADPSAALGMTILTGSALGLWFSVATLPGVPRLIANAVRHDRQPTADGPTTDSHQPMADVRITDNQRVAAIESSGRELDNSLTPMQLSSVCAACIFRRGGESNESLCPTTYVTSSSSAPAARG
jgi:hypothetical protein